MSARAEAVLQAHCLTEPANLVVAELDDCIAFGALQVIVRRITIIVLVGGPVGQAEFAEQARLDQETQSPVDRRSAHPAAGIVHVGDQLVGVEMLVRVKDVADEDATRLGQFLAANFQKLAELLFRAFGNQEWAKGLGIRHKRCSSGDHSTPSLSGTRPVRESITIVILATHTRSGKILPTSAGGGAPAGETRRPKGSLKLPGMRIIRGGSTG